MDEINQVDVKTSDAIVQMIPPEQDAPEVFEINAGVYIWERKMLLESDSLYNRNTAVYVMPAERSIDIDSFFDLQMVNCIMRMESGGN